MDEHDERGGGPSSWTSWASQSPPPRRARSEPLMARKSATILIPTAGALENLARLRDPHSEVQAKLSGSGTNPTH